MENFAFKLFEGTTLPIPSDPTEPVNLKCVAALETDEKVVLMANRRVTGIEHSINFHKDKHAISFDDNPAAITYTKKLFFSLFLGLLNFKDSLYFVFADQVKCHRFGSFHVFDISSVAVYTHNSLDIHTDLSQVLSEYYRLGFLFSYELDLTDSVNYLSAFDIGKDPFKYRMNFLYFANRNLISTCITPVNKEWAVPIIYGRLQRDTIYDDDEVVVEVYFLYKASVLDINNRYKHDTQLLEDFYCPTSFHAIDTFITQNNKTASFGVVFNDFPGVTKEIKSRNKGDYFTSQISPRKIAKYFEFMRYFAHSTRFVFSGKKESVELMSTVADYLKANPSFRKIIRHMIALESDSYAELLKACDLITDQLNSIDKPANAPTSEFNGTYISFCTERPIEAMEECFAQIYLSYLKQDPSYQNILSKSKRLITDEKVDAGVDPEATLELQRQIVKSIFHVIGVSKSHLSNLEPYLRANLKALAASVPFDKVIKQIYGSRNNISKSYMKILNRFSLPVFNTKEMKIAVVTHNCGGTVVDKNKLKDIYYSQLDSIRQADLVIIGLQEILEMKSKNWGKIIKNDNQTSLMPWVEALAECFKDFDIVSHVSMLGLLLVVFIRRSITQIFDVSLHELELIKMGLMNLANKGGIFLRLKINYVQIGIFNCHLAAGTNLKAYKKRQENLTALANYLEEQPGLTMSFIIGDMNFRNTLECQEAERLINKYLKSKTYEEALPYLQELIKSDELSQFVQHSKGTSLEHFKERAINFLPSYKWHFDRNAYNYDGSKRTPSW